MCICKDTYSLIHIIYKIPHHVRHIAIHFFVIYIYLYSIGQQRFLSKQTGCQAGFAKQTDIHVLSWTVPLKAATVNTTSKRQYKLF